MSEVELDVLIARHRTRGILTDSNVLLLFLVGLCDVDLIPRFKRTRDYSAEDFEILRKLLSRFEKIVTTPNVATEVNGLANHLRDDWKIVFSDVFKERVAVMKERFVPSANASRHDRFPTFGLSDTIMLMSAEDGQLVLTDDASLYRLLEWLELPCINFSHLRQFDS